MLGMIRLAMSSRWHIPLAGTRSGTPAQTARKTQMAKRRGLHHTHSDLETTPPVEAVTARTSNDGVVLKEVSSENQPRLELNVIKDQ